MSWSFVVITCQFALAGLNPNQINITYSVIVFIVICYLLIGAIIIIRQICSNSDLKISLWCRDILISKIL